jgi:hypothetical protein
LRFRSLVSKVPDWTNLFVSGKAALKFLTARFFIPVVKRHIFSRTPYTAGQTPAKTSKLCFKKPPTSHCPSQNINPSNPPQPSVLVLLRRTSQPRPHRTEDERSTPLLPLSHLQHQRAEIHVSAVFAPDVFPSMLAAAQGVGVVQRGARPDGVQAAIAAGDAGGHRSRL